MPKLTLPAIAIMEVWWGLGYHTMFYLAGLAAIPRELSEAARVDGANEWRLFWHVTLPQAAADPVGAGRAQVWTAMAVIDEYLILGGFNRALPTYTWTVYMWTLRSRSATGSRLCRGDRLDRGRGDVGRGERTLLGLPFA